MRGRGAEVHIIDIAAANHAQLVNELRGVDAVVSTVVAFELLIQKPLAKAAKEAGVNRFIPCDWATACVPGEMQLHDLVGINFETNLMCWIADCYPRKHRYMNLSKRLVLGIHSLMLVGGKCAIYTYEFRY